jgi:WD40 repeat protein
MSPKELEEIDHLIQSFESKGLDNITTSVEEICKDKPHLEEAVRNRLGALKKMAWLSQIANSSEANSEMAITNPQPLYQFTSGDQPIPGVILEKLIGQGGFGQVWRGKNETLKTIAIKILPKDKGSTEIEKTTLAWLQAMDHPNLLKIFELKETDTFLFVLMELADGTLFDSFTAAKKSGSSHIPFSELLPFMQQAATAIDFLNDPQHGIGNQGIQHRDIKPQNLLLVNGVLKVGDFGLARLLSHTMTSHTGTLTLAFAAPEFFEGKTYRQSDQYSLACTFCQLATGRLPFDGTAAEIVAGHLRGTPNLQLLSEDQQAVVEKALSKKPQNRWKDCNEFVKNLEKSSLKKPFLSRRQILGGSMGGLGLAYLSYHLIAKPEAGNQDPWPLKISAPTFIHKLSPQHHIGPVREISIGSMQFKNLPSRKTMGISNGAFGPAVWNIQSGTLIESFGKEHGGACATLAPLESPFAATGADNNKISLWNLDSNLLVNELLGHKSSVNSVQFSRDASKIASCACDGLIKIWDFKTGNCIHTFKAESRITYTLAFGPTGAWLATGSWDGKVQIWNIEAKAKTDLGNHPGKVWRVIAAENSKTIITSGTDGLVKIWDITSGKETHSLEHSHEITGLYLAERNYLFAGGGNKVYVYTWPDLQLQYTIDISNDIETLSACIKDEYFICLSVGTKKEGTFIYALPMAEKKPKAV